MLREQPLAPPQQAGAPKLQAPPLNKTADKKGKKGKSTPRDNRISKKKAKKPREDDTISNIPDEMPDLEINREHAEPFYTDEQLM
ncbi:hypothetical protein CAEBREN_02861 [Caenorhabditis brenneri]|uniref:Uncharacterized protein n=1 Tax=Caenorhabditis brenneri TaxID=135651 RepID=G0NSH2_CAEBE|nr:hypothetical protein CAEBREN_02861 [Caenorhabditis brenneri]